MIMTAVVRTMEAARALVAYWHTAKSSERTLMTVNRGRAISVYSPSVNLETYLDPQP